MTETIEVDLSEPLGTRDLVGCGNDDCRSLEPESWFGSWEVDAVTSQDGVVVANAGALWSFGNDGAVLWNHDPGSTQLLQATFDVVVAYDGQTTKAYDQLTGVEIWQTDGFIAADDEGTVYVCRSEDAEVLAAVDVETGAERWHENLPCGYLAVRGDLITIVAIDRDVDGGHELLLVDSSTGDVILRKTLDDGIDDQVNGFEGVVLAGDRVVIAGHQADLVVLGSDAEELIRRPAGLGTPIGVADGLVIVAAHDRVAAINPTNGETAWESQALNRDSLAVSEDTLWSLDAQTGNVSRLDPETSDPLWTTPVSLVETFKCVTGSMVARVGRTTSEVAVGETVEVAEGQVHGFLNTGADKLIFESEVIFPNGYDARLDLMLFAELYDRLKTERPVNKKTGEPPTLQMAVLTHDWQRVIKQPNIAGLLMPALAAAGKLAGYRSKPFGEDSAART